MAIQFAFLENIAQRSAFNPDAPPPENLAEAVRDNLMLLLNTRRGAVAHLPDYGAPDLADYYQGFPHSLEDLGATMEATVTRYEPRLRNVSVTLEDESLDFFQASYLISGSIVDAAGRALEVSFHTIVSGNGETEVSL